MGGAPAAADEGACVEQALPAFGLGAALCVRANRGGPTVGARRLASEASGHSLEASGALRGVEGLVASYAAFDTVAAAATAPTLELEGVNRSRALAQLAPGFASLPTLLAPRPVRGSGVQEGSLRLAQLVSGVSSVQLRGAPPDGPVQLSVDVLPSNATRQLVKGGGACHRDHDCNQNAAAGGTSGNVCCGVRCACADGWWGAHCDFHLRCVASRDDADSAWEVRHFDRTSALMPPACSLVRRIARQGETWEGSSCRAAYPAAGEPRVSCACELSTGDWVAHGGGSGSHHRVAAQLEWEEHWHLQWVPNSELTWRCATEGRTRKRSICDRRSNSRASHLRWSLR